MGICLLDVCVPREIADGDLDVTCLLIHFKNERLAYCRYWRQKYVESDETDFPVEVCAVIAKITKGLTFVYLKELAVHQFSAAASETRCEDVEWP